MGGGIKKVLISPFNRKAKGGEENQGNIWPQLSCERCACFSPSHLCLDWKTNTQKQSNVISATYFWLDKPAIQDSLVVGCFMFLLLLNRVLYSTEIFSDFTTDTSSTAVPQKSQDSTTAVCVGSQLTPVNGLLARLPQQLIGFRKMLTAKESSIHRQWGGVSSLQDMVPLLEKEED